MDRASADQTPKTVYLKDYTPPDYGIDRVQLRFDLGEESTTVTAALSVVRQSHGEQSQSRPLVLDGQELELLALRIDGATLRPDRYQVTDSHLIIPEVPDAFELEIVTRIRPQDNTSLEGLYKSSGNFCTQCEAEGFRKITYFLDRPDVMAVYTTTLVADKDQYPILLSNGNLIEQGELEDGRHWATWHDPFKKPSYLFALVAGHLKRLEDTFTTRSGRQITLHIYVEPENIDQCDHAMASLKKAMRWDEDVFGLEYDLDIYMIVAVGDFNMGAMENKGLNVFNTKYVLAKPDTATDMDYWGIEGVIAHEYFHNWTGNRVTCRDWFQLSLKEGLTVFRDQEFSADMGSRGVKRISDVRILRSSQFAQDAGPMAHPVRPDSYMEINNFYTVTVYNKGAEVIRMMHTLLGKQGFRRGIDLYFARHDGQAVTTDDFVAAMEDANGADLQQFRRWYYQAGTPEIKAEGEFDQNTDTYTLKVRQSCPPTPGQSHKEPFHIPITLALLSSDGQELPLQLEDETSPAGTQRVLQLAEAEQVFRFVNVSTPVTPSLLRGFSAPVKLDAGYTDADLMFLLAHDKDSFNRWDAAHTLAIRTILKLVEERRQGQVWQLPETFVNAFAQALGDASADPALLNQLLILPDETYLAEQMNVVDVDGIHEARDFVRQSFAKSVKDLLLAQHAANSDSGEYKTDSLSVGRRSLKNRCLDYLMQLNEPTIRQRCLQQYQHANNMTDTLSALSMLANCDCPERRPTLDDFYQHWQQEPLVLDKWFTLQATSQLPGTLEEVKTLLKHPAFNLKNPNKVRALISAFCQGNPVRFHAIDGSGYTFLTEQVLALNAVNPQIAARLMGSFTRWRKYDPQRQMLMRHQLERILSAPQLSPDVYEIAAKSFDVDEKL